MTPLSQALQNIREHYFIESIKNIEVRFDKETIGKFKSNGRNFRISVTYDKQENEWE